MSLAIHLTARHMQNLREILKATRANSCKLNFLLQLRIDWRFWLWEYQMTLELDKQLAKASKSRQSCKFSPTWALSTFHWGPILMKYWFRVRLYKCTAGWIGSIREANFDEMIELPNKFCHWEKQHCFSKVNFQNGINNTPRIVKCIRN